MSGLMQILLLKVSAHITEQLGMAPGGEFREAFKEVIRAHKCNIVENNLIMYCCFCFVCLKTFTFLF